LCLEKAVAGTLVLQKEHLEQLASYALAGIAGTCSSHWPVLVYFYQLAAAHSLSQTVGTPTQRSDLFGDGEPMVKISSLNHRRESKKG
jgi:hypothetical protein